MIELLVSKGAIAVYCHPQSGGLWAGILIVARGGLTRLYDPDTQQEYHLVLPPTATYYSVLIPYASTETSNQRF